MKNKILYVICCLLVVFTITGCGKKKEENNNNNNNVQSTKTGLMSIALKNNKEVVSFSFDGTEKTLMDISNNYDEVLYTINDNKLYLYLFKYGDKQKSSLGYIDLKDENNTFNLIADNVDGAGYPVSIAVINDVIYYTSISGTKIYSYDLKTDKNTITNDLKVGFKTSRTHLYNIENDKLVYMIYGSSDEKSVLGILDIKTKETKKIADNCSLESIYGDKLLYLVYDEKSNADWTYYEYNTATNSSKVISDKSSGGLSLGDSLVIPVDDYYVYVSKDTIYKYTDKSEEIKKLDDFIDETTLISENKILVEYGMSMDDEAKHGILDLTNKEFKEINKIDRYTRVLYIK